MANPKISNINTSITHNLFKRSVGSPHTLRFSEKGLLRNPYQVPSPQLLHQYYSKRFADNNESMDVKRVNGCYSNQMVALSMKPDTSRHSLLNMLINKRLKPHHIPLADKRLDKIMSSEWLDEHRILLGSVDGNLQIYNRITKKYTSVEPLINHQGENNMDEDSDMLVSKSVIKINPSRTLIATEGKDINSVAIYSLPSMTPFAVGIHELANWTKDICWLNDSHLVTSTNGIISCWKVNENPINIHNQLQNNQIATENIYRLTSFQQHNSMGREPIRLASDGQWIFGFISDDNLYAFVPFTTQHFRLRTTVGTVNTPVVYNDKLNLLAFGSKAEFVLYDPRTPVAFTAKINSYHWSCGDLLSVQCSEKLLSIGTISGEVLFVDLRYYKQGYASYYGNILLAPNEIPFLPVQEAIDDFYFTADHTSPSEVIQYDRMDVKPTRYYSEIGLRATVNESGPLIPLENIVNDVDIQRSMHLWEVRKRTTSYSYFQRGEEYPAIAWGRYSLRRSTGVDSSRMAVFTHSYSPSRSCLLVAGGPRSVCNHGAFFTLFS